MRACKCVCEHVSLYSEPRHHSDNYDQRSIMESHPTLTLHPLLLNHWGSHTRPHTHWSCEGEQCRGHSQVTAKQHQWHTSQHLSFINPFDPAHTQQSSHGGQLSPRHHCDDTLTSQHSHAEHVSLTHQCLSTLTCFTHSPLTHSLQHFLLTLSDSLWNHSHRPLRLSSLTHTH